MRCYHPVPAAQDAPGAPVRLLPQVGTANLALPCGTCVGCRTRRAVEWSRRCMHEARRFDHNVFVTLTYDDTNLPRDGNLSPRALQLFLKRLRKKATSSSVVLRSPESGIRFFASGEYGDSSGRPHYHALFFNCDFRDKVVAGKDLYTSDWLRDVWPLGEVMIGEVTARSANYVAQYSMKKLGARLHCDADGVVRQEPFLRMSRRPGIGSDFVDRHHRDLAGGFLVYDGVRGPVPRAYKRKLDPEVVASFEARSASERRRHPSDKNSPARLAAAEVIALRRVDSHSL